MPVDSDAREYGQHLKQGGWRMGFLVARCCDPSSKGGRPSQDENRSQVNSSGKVSLREFATMAGVSLANVSYCYRAWQLAAEEGHCTPADQLTPDSEDGGRDDIDEDGDEDRKLWLKFSRKVRERNTDGAEHGKTQTGRKSSNGRKRRAKADSENTETQSESTSQPNTVTGNSTCVTAHARQRARRGRTGSTTPAILRARAYPHPPSTPPQQGHPISPAANWDSTRTRSTSTVTTGASVHYSAAPCKPAKT